ncbi:hypothetical protein [Rhodoblastus sp.]|uniref:hypothetical protein n=1 Tax=Rhodoblastus sp. TaxID=1962975 RepID=UPI003F9D2B33
MDRDSGGPAILRLKLLEAKIVARRPMDEDARRHAASLIDALRRAIAERPCLSFADVVAKLKTCDELSDGALDAPAEQLRKTLIKDALAGLARVEQRR